MSSTGTLSVIVRDELGTVLPGVTLTVTGVGGSQIKITDYQGHGQFYDLPPGSWAMESQLEGFQTNYYPNIEIRVGKNTSIAVKLLTEIIEE